MDDLKIGDRVRARPNVGFELGQLPEMTGTVVYIHPERRFYTAEFSFDGPFGRRSFREAFILPPDADRTAGAPETGYRRRSRESLLLRDLMD